VPCAMLSPDPVDPDGIDANCDGVDGDGLDDFLVGAPGNEDGGWQAGKVYVVHSAF
jgi:hypothetical protein